MTPEEIFIDFKIKLIDFWKNLNNEERRNEILKNIPNIYDIVI